MPDAQTFNTCYYAGSISEFLNLCTDKLVEHLKCCHKKDYPNENIDSQITAWEECVKILKDELNSEQFATWTVILEYKLPRERGRRPDVLLLAPGKIFVLEFKGFSQIKAPHIDQVKAYARDLADYHSACREVELVSVLVLTKAKELDKTVSGVRIIDPTSIVKTLTTTTNAKQIQLGDFLNGEYSPLPSIIEAARTIFQKESLPQIRKAESAGIPQALEKMKGLSNSNSKKLLLSVTGVPGSGKTLLGLQFVYDQSNQEKGAVFLSGNGPLVQVLQYMLENKVFVQDVHGFLGNSGGGKQPKESIWIFDEAQRAWDDETANSKRNGQKGEPTEFVKLAMKKDEPVILVGLIGEGQEIHTGEEGGIVQWAEAIRNYGKLNGENVWKVACPKHIASKFNGLDVEEANELNLTTSLRTHRASHLQNWVKLVFEGEVHDAKQDAENLDKDGYPIYISRNLDAAKNYVTSRYQEACDKYYGIICSSSSNVLPCFGIKNDFNSTKSTPKGPWYEGDCKNLNTVMTEFGCQGLELDFTIVGWENDLLWNGEKWVLSLERPNKKQKDPRQLRINSYRVLLTRARDGMVIYLPDTNELSTTYDMLIACGCKPLT